MLRPGIISIALCAALVAVPTTGSAQAEKRVALVIGNATYKEGGALQNSVNDARLMAATLRDLGFKVIARENSTKQQMERAIAEFGDTLIQGSVGMFFYAGHGIQVNGRNFLVPVDANIISEARVRLEALDIDVVIDQMAAAGSSVNLVLLDACRNNPFERRFRSSGAGLAQINAPKGTLIGYSTAPGKVAADGEGPNSIYTAKLVQAMKTPGLPIEDVFKRVRVDVSRETKDEQTPWEASSLTGSFYFIEPKRTPPGSSEADKEMIYWESIKGSDDPEVLRAYLARYPNGSFADLAKAKLDAAERKQRERAAAPPPISGEQAVWDLVKDLKDPAIFEVFLDKYPRGAHAEAAKLKLAALSKEQKKTQVAAAPVPAPTAATPPPPAPAAAPSTTSTAKPGESEDEMWERIRNSGDAEALREYLRLYPKGAYAATVQGLLHSLSGPKSELTATPAIAARPPIPSGGVDGIWHGTYSCGPLPRWGQPAFTSTQHVFAVKNGQLTGVAEWPKILVTERYQGTITPGGKVVISGSGENRRSGGGYSMSFEGKEDGGYFTAKGRHAGSDCTLTYRKVQ